MNGINPTYIQGYATSITTIINSILVPVLISIAFIVFLWGVYNYFILGADNETKRSEGKTFALYGIIGFVVLFSVWGIVNIFMGTLGLSTGNVPAFPTIGNSTGVPAGTNPFGGTPTGGTPSGNSVTDAQLQQLYTSYTSACSTFGNSSPQCQQAYSAYTSSAANSGLPLNGSCANQPSGSCPTGYNCSSGYCVSSSSTGGSIGSACPSGSDNDCLGDLRCNNNVCSQSSALGGSCSKDTDCAGSNTVCSTDVCVNGSRNDLPNGSSCTSSGDCASRFCNLSSSPGVCSLDTGPMTNTSCTSRSMGGEQCITSNGSAGVCTLDQYGDMNCDTSAGTTSGNVGDPCVLGQQGSCSSGLVCEMQENGQAYCFTSSTDNCDPTTDPACPGFVGY